MTLEDFKPPASDLNTEELRKVFDSVDRNGDGSINKHEIIIALRKNKDIAELLGLPTKIRQEDGSRAAVEAFFDKYDTDQSKSLEWEEFLAILQEGKEALLQPPAPDEVLALEDVDMPPEPTPEEVAAALSHLGKTADGLRQAYLKVQIAGTGLASTDLLTKYPQLQTVVLSGNYLKDLKSLGQLQTLTHLDVSKNRIDDVLQIAPPTPTLRYADLSMNYIKKIEDLSAFQSLVTLKLDGNSIREITGLATLVTLRKLSLKDNNLVSVSGLEKLTLHELDVTNNQVPSLEPLAPIATLQRVRAGKNRITHLKGTASLQELALLDVSDNEIPSLEELGHLVRLSMLKELSIANNLMEKVRAARLHTLYILPGLVSLNGQAVDPKEKVHASNVHGNDYRQLVDVRTRHFHLGELDDGGGASPPACVTLPACDGKGAKWGSGVDAFAVGEETGKAALSGYEAISTHLQSGAQTKMDLVRACYVWLWTYCESVPDQPTSLKTVLAGDLRDAEVALCKGVEGNWPERLSEVYCRMLAACGVEAHVVSGYWHHAGAAKLISPNHAWCAVYVCDTWRLVDIAFDKKAGSMDTFYTAPEEFVKTRYPLMIQWQLLEKYKLPEDFWPLPKDLVNPSGQ